MTGEHAGSIGVFDSGVGGISVLRALVDALPGENFAYYGDSAYAPYGEKTTEQVLLRSRDVVDSLLGQGCKAVVIACNTATSAAAATLRADYARVPIIGVEPALKPAALALGQGRILVMATPITLQLDKYQQLAKRWGEACEVVPAPCPGLAARIEQGNLDSPDVMDLLDDLVGGYHGEVDAVVLGCTHYPFVARQIREVVGDVPLYDGSEGTARQLKRRLSERGLLAKPGRAGSVAFASSRKGSDEVALYRRFFEMPLS